MGSPTTHLYDDASARSGFEQACTEVRDIRLSGDRDGAAVAVPDEMVWRTTLTGDEATRRRGDGATVRERIRRDREVGVDEPMLHPVGRSPAGQLEVLGRAVPLVREEGG